MRARISVKVTIAIMACASFGVMGGAMGGVMGCVVNEPETPARGVVVSGPPPAPVREERPAAPSAGSTWVGGYWHWTGMQYAWIPGHWEGAPPGATWSAPRYVTADGAYYYEPGGWKDRAGAPASAAPPRPLPAPPRASALH